MRNPQEATRATATAPRDINPYSKPDQDQAAAETLSTDPGEMTEEEWTYLLTAQMEPETSEEDDEALRQGLQRSVRRRVGQNFQDINFDN